MKQWLANQTTAKDPAQRAHYQFALAQIKNFEEKPAEMTAAVPLAPPDGAPIGTPDNQWLEMGCGEF